jgi:hypothetical protein
LGHYGISHASVFSERGAGVYGHNNVAGKCHAPTLPQACHPPHSCQTRVAHGVRAYRLPARTRAVDSSRAERGFLPPTGFV